VYDVGVLTSVLSLPHSSLAGNRQDRACESLGRDVLTVDRAQELRVSPR
jgi:hypothetical protein